MNQSGPVSYTHLDVYKRQFMYLSAGYLDERGEAPAHNPKVKFNEDVCPIGSSCLAHCATEWLKNNK